jgi:hypothetical protein
VTRSAREVLLEEARDRHKLELARYTEAHTRIAVHLAILAVFALALLRFIDQPPAERGSFVFWLFIAAGFVLLLATVGVLVCLLAVIWGYGTRFPAPMAVWREQEEKLRASYPEDGGRVTEELEERLTRNLCESADDNARKNALRSKFIVAASRGLVVATVAFVVSGAAYLCLSIGRDTSAAVRIVGRVEVMLRPHGEESLMSKTPHAEVPAAPPPTMEKPPPPPPPPPPATVLHTDSIDIECVRSETTKK